MTGVVRSTTCDPSDPEWAVHLISPAPILDGEQVRAACLVPSSLPRLSSASEAPWLVPIDAGLARHQDLDLQQIFDRQMSSWFICGSLAQLAPGLNRQVAEVDVRPLFWNVCSDYHAADVMLCLVFPDPTIGHRVLKSCTSLSVVKGPIEDMNTVRASKDAMYTLKTWATQLDVTRVDDSMNCYGKIVAVHQQMQKELQKSAQDMPGSSGFLAENLEKLHRSSYLERSTIAEGVATRCTISGLPVLALPDELTSTGNTPMQASLESFFEEYQDKIVSEDKQHLEAALRYIDMGQTMDSNPEDDHRLLCDYHSAVGRLCPLDDVMVGSQLNRVRDLGSIITAFPLNRPGESGQQVRYISMGPGVVAENATDGKTYRFIQNVEVHDPYSELDKLCSFFEEMGIPWIEDQGQRKARVVDLYMNNQRLYEEVNLSLWTDDEVLLPRLAPYIRALRSLFERPQQDEIEGFEFFGEAGQVVERRMQLDEDQINLYLLEERVCWPHFALARVMDLQKVKLKDLKNEDLSAESAREATAVRVHFDGDLPNAGYVPAVVGALSRKQHPHERVVMFPPHCMFRIENVDGCKTYDDPNKWTINLALDSVPSVWKLIREKDWQRFKEWADAHPQLVNSHGSLRSVICEVARSLASETRQLDEDPVEMCLSRGAQANEVDDDGKTALSILASEAPRQIRAKDTNAGSAVVRLLEFGAHSVEGVDVSSIDFSYRHVNWQYWHDKVQENGKTSGWYPFSRPASDTLESKYQAWLLRGELGAASDCNVRSGEHEYRVWFKEMKQQKSGSGKERRVRRAPKGLDEGEDFQVKADFESMLRVLQISLCEGTQEAAERLQHDVSDPGLKQALEAIAEASDDDEEALKDGIQQFDDALAQHVSASSAAADGGEHGSTQHAHAMEERRTEELQSFRRTAKSLHASLVMGWEDRGEARKLIRAVEDDPNARLEKNFLAESQMTVSNVEVFDNGGKLNAAFRVTLSWQNSSPGVPTDLDMHMKCPDCEKEVYFSHKECGCAEEQRRLWLDVDMRGEKNDSTENMTVDQPSAKGYECRVRLFSGQPVPFTVLVRRAGYPDREYKLGPHKTCHKKGEMRIFSAWMDQKGDLQLKSDDIPFQEQRLEPLPPQETSSSAAVRPVRRRSSQLVKPPGQRSHLLISGRFNSEEKIEYMKRVKELLDDQGVPTFMVEAQGAGDTFGDKTVLGLYQAKALVAFCTADYGAKTGAQYETYVELQYAHQEKLPIIPVQICDTFPPKPDDLEGQAQNHFVFRSDIIRIMDVGMSNPSKVASDIHQDETPTDELSKGFKKRSVLWFGAAMYDQGSKGKTDMRRKIDTARIRVRAKCQVNGIKRLVLVILPSSSCVRVEHGRLGRRKEPQRDIALQPVPEKVAFPSGRDSNVAVACPSFFAHARLDTRGSTEESRTYFRSSAQLSDYDAHIRATAAELGVEVEHLQTNDLDECIRLLSGTDANAIVINPAGFGKEPALVECIAALRKPVFEVHYGNFFAKGATSLVTAACNGLICGAKLSSYSAGMCFAGFWVVGWFLRSCEDNEDRDGRRSGDCIINFTYVILLTSKSEAENPDVGAPKRKSEAVALVYLTDSARSNRSNYTALTWEEDEKQKSGTAFEIEERDGADQAQTAPSPTVSNLQPFPVHYVPPSQRSTPAPSYVPSVSSYVAGAPQSPASQTTWISSRGHSFGHGSPSQPRLEMVKQKPFWLVELKDRIWPEISRYMGQEIVGNFQAAGAPNREKTLQDMVQKLESKPLQLPIESSWTNFLMNLVWPVIGPEVSAAMKDIIAPKLHNKLSFLAPITVEVDLGTVPPEFGEVEVLEDTEMGSFMDLKLHLHWHAKPKIVVTCKLGTVELTTMQLGCTFYFGFHNKVPEPPFFDAVCMYMGNAFMHARDVLGTDLAMDDPYLGMDFTHGWTGLDSRFVEDAIVGAVNGTFGPWMVLPQRVVMPMREFPFSFDLGNPMPKGCLKLTVKGANGLVGTEWKMASILTGSRSNDPYVTVDLGGTAERTLRTPTCYNTLEPAWKDHNSFFFVIDALRIQHFNFRIWDDGFMQQLREQHLGVASEGDEMARKLGVRVLDLFGVQSLDYFDREREVERTCELEQGWPGKEHPDPENGGKAMLELGLQWRPISQSVSAQLPPDVFLDDEEGSEEEEEEVRWPLFVLRVGVQHLEMRRWACSGDQGVQLVRVYVAVEWEISSSGLRSPNHSFLQRRLGGLGFPLVVPKATQCANLQND
ncbi:SYT4 [Symbiodinium sp. CCMP2456]|nr:SYT4 [Symbiodinium sp. CCMP2456]